MSALQSGQDLLFSRDNTGDRISVLAEREHLCALGHKAAIRVHSEMVKAFVSFGTIRVF